MPIDRFTDEYSFLSNFSPSTVLMYGESYPTVEHAYQAAKTTVLNERAVIRHAPTPGQAKRLGRRVTLRSDWNAIRVDVMHELLRRKFAHPSLAVQLLATGDEELIEGNTWGDRFWGVYDGTGRNMLGQLLMKVRKELRTD